MDVTDVWDPLSDPADEPPVVVANQLRDVARIAEAQGDMEAESLAALAGPLAREAVLSSSRMREVEEWIAIAEAEGLPAEEILPAKQRLHDLAKGNRSIHWRREEEKEAKQQVEASEMSEARERLQLVMLEVDRFLKDDQGGVIVSALTSKMKDAITEAYNSGVNVKFLISARQKLKLLEAFQRQCQKPPATRSFAKEMLQAMKDKDTKALRRVMEEALQHGVQLKGLEVARQKLKEWEASQYTRSQSAPKQLRIVLPDGRRGWLPIELSWTGSMVAKSLPVQEPMALTLARETTHRGSVEILDVALDLERPLSQQAEFFQKGAALACRSISPATLWEDVIKAISVPFPSFHQVQQLLTTSQHRVILAWEETKHRCEEAVDLLQANHVVLVQASDEGKLSVPSTFVPLEETLGRGEEMLKVLRQIEALDLPRPFVLVLLCRASSSRRLVQTLKRHLPEDISLFPLPPDFRTACEEAQRFPSQCFEEARWLQMEGVHLPERCLKALDRLKPSWRDEVATSRISADVVDQCSETNGEATKRMRGGLSWSDDAYILVNLTRDS